MKTIATLILAASFWSVHAQTSAPYAALKDGDRIEAQSIAFDFGAPVPMPPGTWRLLKRHEYDVKNRRSWSGLDKYTRLTFSNEDKSSSALFFSLSTNLEKTGFVARDSFKCTDLKDLEPKLVVVDDFNLSSSGSEFGCAISRTFEPSLQFTSIAKQDLPPQDDRGFREGVAKPILSQDRYLKSLGNSALLVDFEIEGSFARLANYTYIIPIAKTMTGPNRSPSLVEWMRTTGLAFLQVNQDKTVQPPAPPADIRDIKPAENKLELIAYLSRNNPDDLTKMFADATFPAKYLEFLKKTPELDRAFCTNKKGNIWGWAAKSWPYNERRAYATCYEHGRGKQSPLVFHTTDRHFHGVQQD